jgi:soluble lytic murein transglycosylase-like protein
MARFCFIRSVVGGLVLVASVAQAGEVEAFKPSNTYRTTVRVDNRTGKLVRTGAVARQSAIARPQNPGQAAKDISATKAAVDRLVEEAAHKHGLDPLLAKSVLSVESGYNQFATSPKGAMGYMQLMPGTAKMLGVQNAYDAQQNIEAGVKYLRYLKSKFQDERLVLAAYNAGEGAVAKYGWIPPYRETVDYVMKVGMKYQEAAKRSEVPVAADANAVGEAAIVPQPKVLQTVDAEGRIVLSIH